MVVRCSLRSMGKGGSKARLKNHLQRREGDVALALKTVRGSGTLQYSTVPAGVRNLLEHRHFVSGSVAAGMIVTFVYLMKGEGWWEYVPFSEVIEIYTSVLDTATLSFRCGRSQKLNRKILQLSTRLTLVVVKRKV